MTAAPAPGQYLDEPCFHTISELAFRESGLRLSEAKRVMIQSRLRHRLKALSMSDFPAYCDFVTSEAGGTERRLLISALTTNVSHFFRERHHFDRLTEHVKSQHLPRLRAGKQLRIWSAGCAYGQEPISAAIALLEKLPALAEYDLRILATDIDSEVIRTARNGVLPARLLEELPAQILARYFTPEQAGYRLAPALQKIIQFNELNLLAPWPMRRRFDMIFCRNVVIYFDQETQNSLWPRFHPMIKPGGFLFLGHSERIIDPKSKKFTADGPTTYRPIYSELE
ncbi:MAG: CheR family methyltransferase [Sulfitobacter sp.]